MEYDMAPQVYNRMVQQLGGQKTPDGRICFPGSPAAEKVYDTLAQRGFCVVKHWGSKEWRPMYWHGAQGDTKSTVNKIIADRAEGILVVTGIGVSPCPLDDSKPILDSIILNEMQCGPEEQLFIDDKGIPMAAPGQAWSTRAFLVQGSQCQPTGDEAFIKMVEAVPMRVMFEDKSDSTESVDVLSHSRIHRAVAYMWMGIVMVSSSSNTASARVAIALQSANTSEASRCQLL